MRLLLALTLTLGSCTCDPLGFWGDAAEGEGDVAEGEGDVAGEGEAGEGEGDAAGEGEASEGEGDAGGEGEGEGDAAGEGEGDAGEGEGDVAGEGEGEGDGGITDGSTLGLQIFAADTCDITTSPASITVSAGTGFYVTWTNLGSSAAPVDIDKIDQFNQVPLVIDLEPGQSVTDDVREWCGQFTGTFEFRITSCFDPHFIDVNCGG